MASQHAQAEGLCLRYMEHLGHHANVTQEMAISMLLRGTQLAQSQPFHWGYIDKPSEGSLYLIFIPQQLSFPNDGIRYLEGEQRYSLPVTPTRELEVMEAKFGFVPGHDSAAFRIRRRYRLVKGGHPQLILIHYSRGQSTPIPPALNQPIRSYPLRQYNEPAVFVLGERQGQKVYTNSGPPGDRGPGMPSGPMSMGYANPQIMLAQQNSAMNEMERRARAERERSGSMAGRPPPPRLNDDDDSADESEMISTKALALARYRRNHDFMNAVFNYAAFNKHYEKPDIKASYSIFKEEDLQARIVKLENDIESIKAKSTAREEARDARRVADASIETMTAADGDAVMA